MAVYQRALSLMYVDELLDSVVNRFIKDGFYEGQKYDYAPFNDTFRRLLLECENRATERKNVRPGCLSSAPRTPSTPPPPPPPPPLSPLPPRESKSGSLNSLGVGPLFPGAFQTCQCQGQRGQERRRKGPPPKARAS